jgi:serine/threonine protein kinase
MLCFDNECVQVTLIDFGYAKKYFNEENNHIEHDTSVDQFEGNFLFGSLNQLRFKATSRKDDLYSLMYLMFYMFNDCELPNFDSKYLEDTERESSKDSTVIVFRDMI